MRLRCTNGMFAHWGTIFKEGKEYYQRLRLNNFISFYLLT